MHLRHLVKYKTDEPILEIQKSPIAARQVFSSTDTLKQESQFLRLVI